MTLHDRIARIQKRFPMLIITIEHDTAARVVYDAPGCHLQGWIYANGNCRFDLVSIESHDCAERLLELIFALQA